MQQFEKDQSFAKIACIIKISFLHESLYDFQYYWSNNTLYYSLLWGSFKTNVGCFKPIFQRYHSPELYTLISTRFNVILINNNKTHTVTFNLVMYSIYVTYQIPCSSYWCVKRGQYLNVINCCTNNFHFNCTNLTQVLSLSNFLPLSRAHHGHMCMHVSLTSTYAVSDYHTSSKLDSRSCRGCTRHNLLLESLSGISDSKWFYPDTTLYTNKT